MNPNKEPEEHLDDFSRRIREKVGDYRAPVGDADWRPVYSRARAARRRRLLLAWGASIAALLGGVLWVTDRPSRVDIDTLPAVVAGDMQAEVEVGDSPVYVAAVTRLDMVDGYYPVFVGGDEAVDTAEVVSSVDDRVVVDMSAGEAVPQAVPVARSTVASFGRVSGAKRTAVSALVVSGGGVDIRAPFNDMVYDNPQLDGAPAEAVPVRASDEAMIVPEEYRGMVVDYDDYRCLPPLSLGVMVRRELGGHVAVETGVVYTYLATAFGGAHDAGRARLELHYVGVPVNIVGYMYSGARWDVYSSLGFTVEKGIRSVYTQTQHFPLQSVTYNINTSIHGLQLSVGGALGVSYHADAAWSVFVEPRVSYYFDSEQPISMRAEHPFTISIGGGVRYGF
ncbi:MAG: hypothetical protein LBI58_01235 [Tannerellaceae bacterium]|nr:hypothetical protein [Tannerellaceae bacterium]